jgi:regulator of RNase E activity RraA
VIADEDGVVVVRPELLGRVLELVEIGRGVDEKCRVDLEAGRGVQDTFGEHRGKK